MPVGCEPNPVARACNPSAGACMTVGIRADSRKQGIAICNALCLACGNHDEDVVPRKGGGVNVATCYPTSARGEVMRQCIRGVSLSSGRRVLKPCGPVGQRGQYRTRGYVLSPVAWVCNPSGGISLHLCKETIFQFIRCCLEDSLPFYKNGGQLLLVV